MDCLKLLTEARQAGLIVATEGDRLVIRGPKSAGHIAEALISRKQEIMDLLSRQGPALASDPEPRHPLADFDFSVFGDPPPWIQHKDRDCQLQSFWQHRFGGFYCTACWPCTDSAMQIETDDRPEPRQESGNQPKPATEWTAEEKQLVDWLDDNYDRLIDETETFQHQIDIAGLILVLRRGPAAQGSKQAVSGLRILQRNPTEFHAEMARRHERELGQWNPRYRREK
ncbi:MAG: hypothetical protein IH999_10800 [Proteobacteria bacterium]|nr:hypothetical protein [Pseudomonadota bacterium]